MPYPNFHAARLKNPDLFAKIRVFKIANNQSIYFYGGTLKSNPSGAVVTQAIRFKASIWTVKQAKEWLTKHKYKWIMFEPATGK